MISQEKDFKHMSINIGNDNKIKNSIISEHTSIKGEKPNQSFTQKHPVIIGISIAVIAGFILTFSFWDKLKSFIDELIY